MSGEGLGESLATKVRKGVVGALRIMRNKDPCELQGIDGWIRWYTISPGIEEAVFIRWVESLEKSSTPQKS